MDQTYGISRFEADNPDLLRMATSVALIGSALGLLAALLLGG
jgi:hypothetical protein